MRGSPRVLAFFVALLPIVIGVCFAGASLSGGDPTIVVELVLGVVVAAWVTIGARNVLRGRSLARALDAHSVEVALGGVRFLVVRGGGRRAFVLGAFRPRIYVGDRLPEEFDADEIRAVLLHEDHHRRTLAPLRAAALESWLVLFGWIRGVRSAVVERLTDLETQADAHALTRGASAAALASALLKADPIPTLGASSFATSSDRRLRHLLALADGTSATRATSERWTAPYEWLPPVMCAVLLVVCHVTGPPFA